MTFISIAREASLQKQSAAEDVLSATINSKSGGLVETWKGGARCRYPNRQKWGEAWDITVIHVVSSTWMLGLPLLTCSLRSQFLQDELWISLLWSPHSQAVQSSFRFPYCHVLDACEATDSQVLDLDGASAYSLATRTRHLRRQEYTWPSDSCVLVGHEEHFSFAGAFAAFDSSFATPSWQTQISLCYHLQYILFRSLCKESLLIQYLQRPQFCRAYDPSCNCSIWSLFARL